MDILAASILIVLIVIIMLNFKFYIQDDFLSSLTTSAFLSFYELFTHMPLIKLTLA